MKGTLFSFPGWMCSIESSHFSLLSIPLKKVKQIRKYKGKRGGFILMKIGIIGTMFLSLSFADSVNQQDGLWIAPDEANNFTNPYAEDEAAQAEGREQFEVYCWPCHGYEGRGDGIAGVGLPVKPKDFTTSNVTMQSDGALFWKLNTGKGNMISYESLLSEEMRWKLITYVRYLAENGSVLSSKNK